MKAWLEKLLDIVFPTDPEIAEIERLDPEEFWNRARRPQDDPLPNIVSLFDYADPLVRRALWALKYGGNKRIGRLFAELLYDAIIEKLSDELTWHNFTDPILIPLPNSRERRRERGWNQTEIITSALKMKDKNKNFIVRTDILRKIKHTPPQTKLNRLARLKNLKGCFAVAKPEEIKNRNVILIDDIVTTGSTIAEAKQTLLKAGAKRIIAFTIAQ